MEIQEYVRILRARWRAVVAVTLVTLLAALGWSLTRPSVYASSATLLASPTGGNISASDFYGAGQYTAGRVASYATLATGDRVVQRAVDDYKLPISPSELQTKITASTVPGSVLIDIVVQDDSPGGARDYATAVASTIPKVIEEIERPSDGTPAPVRVTIVNEPTFSDVAISPNVKRNIGLGLILGVMLGIGIAVLRDRFDKTVTDRAALAECSGAAVLGVIPKQKNTATNRLDFAAPQFDDSTEAFRQLRTNLQFASHRDAPARLVLVTSGQSGDGTTTVAVNLALAAAQTGKTVALVDANLRRPGIAAAFGLSPTTGLSTAIDGGTALSESLVTGGQNLTILPSGPVPANPSDLLDGNDISRLFEELQSSHDLVILDSAPLLEFSETAGLARLVDGVLIVVRQQRTKTDDVVRVIEGLNDVGATILGTVLTAAPQRTSKASLRSTAHKADATARGAASGIAEDNTALVEKGR